MLLEFFRRVDGAQNFMKKLVRRLDLPPHLVEPFMRNVTVGTFGPDARPVLEMNSLLQLLVYVIPHFVAGNAELLGIRHLHRPVEATPKDYSADPARDEQRTKRKARTGTPEKGPDALDQPFSRSTLTGAAHFSSNMSNQCHQLPLADNRKGK